MWIWTRSRSRRPDIPMCDSPRDTLPLPAEITRRILFFVSEPAITYDGRKRTYKYGGPRNLHHPPDDIESARLVCKTFADLGAEFLLRNLIVSADHKQLAHVKEMAGHERLCKAVRSLYYDCRTYTDIWTKKSGGDIDDDSSDFEEDEDVAHYRRPPFAPAQRLLYNEQEDIFNRSLDTDCLRAALATLTAVTRVRCKPRERSHHDPGDVSSAGRRGYDHGGGGPGDDRDARPLYHLAVAMTSVPGGRHNIRTLDLAFHLTLLADARLAPARFASLLAALAPVTSLTLGLRTDDAGLCRPRDFAKYAAAYGPHATAPSLFKAILQGHIYSTTATTATTTTTTTSSSSSPSSPGPLAALADATSPSLHRLKLTLSPDGRRRRDPSPGWRYQLPLSAFLGSAAATTTTTSTTTTSTSTSPSTSPSNPPSVRWPSLRYLSLGCLDATQADLVAVLLPRRASLAYVEFDRVALTSGQWCVVGAAALEACPTWRWSKANRLTQAEAVRKVVELPREVAEAVAEARREKGEEEVVGGGGGGGGTTVRWDECYFAAEEGDSCSTMGSGEAPEDLRGPGYGWPV